MLGVFMPFGTAGVIYDEPGSVIFDSSGTYNFIIPTFKEELIIEMWGAGAAGQRVTGNGPGNGSSTNGTSGTASTITALSLSAGGGNRSGAGGVASGGDINLKGGNASGIGGGASPNSSSEVGNGGRSARISWQHVRDTYTRSGHGGGGGSYLKKTYAKGLLTPKVTVSVVVGERGTNTGNGGNGLRGEVRISWS